MWEDTHEIKARKPPLFDVTFFFLVKEVKRTHVRDAKYLILFYLLLFRISLNLNKHLGMVTLDYSSGQRGYNL